jgi:hypothetical protein
VENLLLIHENLGLIKLKEPRLWGPGEPKCPRIQPCGHQHYLPDRLLASDVLQKVIEKARTQRQ